MNWVIEGSNTNSDYDWKVLDSQANNKSLDYKSAEKTFDISANLDKNESFRYLRLRVTGSNNFTHVLYVSAIEFFGQLFNDK